MSNCTKEELEEAIRPIVSLISKSEKAQQKLAPGTWQFTMLKDNLKALNIAVVLMNKEVEASDSFAEDDLREACLALDSMINKVKKTQTKFSPGTPQRTLQRNRIKALRIALWYITESLNRKRKN
jgi:hypothetical protein